MSTTEKQAAIYARGNTSTQIPQCKSYAQEHGYSVADAHVYSDGFERSGISDPHDSVAIALLLDAAREKAFTVLIVTNLARLSRSQVNLAQILSELQTCGVKVLPLQGGEL